MIAWLNPAALIALAAAAVPIVIHLLLRRRANRVQFPTVRFIAPSEQAAVRLRRPSDILLLAVRVAIVACAALALARPLVLTDARREGWSGRITRAIVVDTSASVNPRRAEEAAAAESRGASASRRFETDTVERGVAQASAWLANVEPGKREIVVVSDFQRGAVTDGDLAPVPAGIGIRMAPVETVIGAGPSAGMQVLHGGEAYGRTVSAEADATSVELRRIAQPSGLEVLAAPHLAHRIQRTVVEAGAVAPSPEQPVVIQFGESLKPADTSVWPADGLRLFARRAIASSAAQGVDIRAFHRGPALVFDVAAPADSLTAAAVTQAVLNARADPRALTEQEPLRIPNARLESWNRPAAPPHADAWKTTTQSDGRWLWLAAILLMGVESLIRRDRVAPSATAEAHAA